MDVFSEALGALRAGARSSARLEVRAPWTLRHPELAGPGCHVVLHGQCVLMPPCGHPLPLRKGDIVFLRDARQNTLYSDPADGPGDLAVLARGSYELDVSGPHPLLASLPPVLYEPAKPVQDTLLYTTVTQLAREMHRPRPGSDSIAATLLDTLLLQLMRLWFETLPPEQGWAWSVAVTDPAIAPALRAIHAEPDRPWTVTVLSKESGLSRAAFARRFTTVVGEPPLSYLTRWRMAMAGRLLRETDIPLAAVAKQAGYGTEYSFAKAFKRAQGTAPGTYRRQAR